MTPPTQPLSNMTDDELVEHMHKHIENMRDEYPDQYHNILADGMVFHIADMAQRLRPRPAPSPQLKTYEKCLHHFSCPNGEDCWYFSQDYYWDCGEGATRLAKEIAHARTTERNAVLKIIAENRNEIIERLSKPFSPEIIKEMQEVVRKHEQESLRTPHHPKGAAAMTLQIIPIKAMVQCPWCLEISDSDLIESSECHSCSFKVYAFANGVHCNYPDVVVR